MKYLTAVSSHGIFEDAKTDVLMIEPGDSFASVWDIPFQENVSKFEETLKKVSRRVPPAQEGSGTSEHRPSDGYISKHRRQGKTEGT